MNLLDIGTLSQISGLPPSALRYYEEIGLIQPVARRGLRRQYDSATPAQLALIALGKAAGFSLEEIRGMFGKDSAPVLPRPALHDRADALDLQIRKLTALKNALRHVAECPAENHMECPKFRKLLRIAARSVKTDASRKNTGRDMGR